MSKNNKENRTEKRVLVNREYKFEFIINSTKYNHRCILWNIAGKGFGVLVNKKSSVFKQFKIGRLMKMRYFEAATGKPSPLFNVEIRHISQNKNEKYKDYYQVGVQILQTKN